MNIPSWFWCVYNLVLTCLMLCSGKFSQFLQIFGKFAKNPVAKQGNFFIRENLSYKSFLKERLAKIYVERTFNFILFTYILNYLLHLFLFIFFK